MTFSLSTKPLPDQAFVFTVQRTLEGGIVASTKARLAEVALDELTQIELCFEFFYIDHGVYPLSSLPLPLFFGSLSAMYGYAGNIV